MSLIHPKYRADIDGLRAIAVLLVILFHAFPSLIPGGFVGVDVFFVISGYLISTIILGSLERKSFSFSEFYARRIKRIFPSLLLVLATCAGMGWVVLLPHEFEQLGKHALGGIGFAVNFILKSESGYFDNAAETKPLLHLWSLCVEEQFYILCPLLLFLAFRLRIKPSLVIAIGWVLSFAANIWTINWSAAGTFFWPHTRFWEILTGSALACSSLRGCDGKRFGNAMAFVGLLLIGGSAMLLSKETPFPGWRALQPVIGAALMIWSGPSAWLNRAVLSSRPFVWIGLISYPLYLWHYPLLSFGNILWGSSPPPEVRAALVVLSFGLAWATFFLLETPIRFRMSNRRAIRLLFASTGAVALFASSIFYQDGFSGRSTPWLAVENEGVVSNEDFFEALTTRGYAFCEPEAIRNDAPKRGETIPRCFQSKNQRPVDIAIYGDSHAEHLFPGLAELLPNHNVAYYVHGRPPPFKNIGEIERLLAFFKDSKQLKSVILSSNWFSRTKRIPADSDLFSELEYIVTKLTESEKRIYLVEGLLTFTFDPQSCKHKRLWPFLNNRCLEDRAVQVEQQKSYIGAINMILAKHPHVKIIRSSNYFCRQHSCFMAADGILFFRDRNHLNLGGSRYAAQRILADFPELAKQTEFAASQSSTTCARAQTSASEAPQHDACR